MTHEAFQFRFQFIYYQIQQPHFFHACPLIITTSVHERQTNQPPQIVYLINNFKVDTGRCADPEYYGAATAHGRRKPISSHMGWTKWATFTWMGTRGGRGPLTHRQDIRNMFPIHFVFDSGSKTGSDC